MHSTSTSTWRHLKYSMMSLWIVWINSIPVRLDRRVNQTRNGESDQNKRRVFIHLWALLFSLAQFCFASFSFRFASFFSFFFLFVLFWNKVIGSLSLIWFDLENCGVDFPVSVGITAARVESNDRQLMDFYHFPAPLPLFPVPSLSLFLLKVR